jgi:hypothetical protein
MSRGYWGIFLAALGCLILAGASPPNKVAPATKAEQRQAPAPRVSPAPAPKEYRPYSNRNADRCYEAQDHEAADLCAQWRAAYAAEKAAKAAERGNWIAGGGALLTFVSVILIIGALAQGREANAIAKKDFESTYKPWLLPRIEGSYLEGSKVNMGKGNGKPRAISAHVWIENIGEMPATVVRQNVYLATENPMERHAKAFFRVVGKGEVLHLVGNGIKTMLIPPDPNVAMAEHEREWRQRDGGDLIGALPLTEELVRAIMFEPPPIVGEVEYLDPLGKRRLMGFAFRPPALWAETFERWGDEKYNFDHEIKPDR